MFCKNCGQKQTSDDSKFCHNCGTSLSAEAKTQQEIIPKIEKSKDNSAPADQYVGLSGWLALVGLGLIVTIISQLWSFFSDINIITDKGSWETLSTYDNFLAPMMLFEEIFCIFMAGAAAYLLILYIKMNIKFPKYYIAFLMINAAYLLLDYLFVFYLSQQGLAEDVLLDEAAANLGRGVIFGIIWIAYITSSKRVKATFTNTYL